MNSDHKNDVMFLVGAGISIPIGIPAMAGTYRQFVNSQKPSLTPKERKLCDLFTKELGVKEDLEEFLLAANQIIEFPDSTLNRFVEKNLSRVKSSPKVAEYNKNLRANVKDVIGIRNGILDFLSKTCFKFDREKAVKINYGLVKSLSNLGFPVFSTNYDYAFEHVAIEKGIKVFDNFISKGQRQIWNERIEFDGDQGFKLIKLHGSVTWYSDDQGNIEKIYYNTNLNPQGHEVAKIVIVPTRFKDIYSQHFFALYSHYLNALTRSKVMIIAGHSLRDDYLRAGIIERNRKGDFQIIVIDPTYPPSLKNELPPVRLGKIGKSIHIPFKWEDFSDELSYILLNYSTDQIAKKCVEVSNKVKYQKNKISFKGNLRELRVLDKKAISLETKGYLKMEQRPASLRVWLSAEYTDTDGTKQNRVYNEFIEVITNEFGADLTGVLVSKIEMAIKIPKVQKWLDVGCNVTINVGLVKSSVSKPSLVREQNLVASCKKTLPYIG